jgi:hypothetical protein
LVEGIAFDGGTVTDKPKIKLPGKVQKIIPPLAREPEKVQIELEGADDLYKEIRVENALDDAEGNSVKLKKGADVDVTVEADGSSTELRTDGTGTNLEKREGI